MKGMRRGLAIAVLLLTVGCSSEQPSVIGLDLVCDQDRSFAQAKDVVERVGGLRTDDFLVRLARSTEVGVVALVDGDVQGAYTVLHEDYGVSVVAQVADDGQGPADGLGQIDRITRAACDGS